MSSCLLTKLILPVAAEDLYWVWKYSHDSVTCQHNVPFETMDAEYKTPWIAKKTLDDGKVPIPTYTRCKRNKEIYKTQDYT